MNSLGRIDGLFRDAGYATVRRIIAEPLRAFLFEYATKLVDSGLLTTTDPDVPQTPSCYADPFMEALLEALIPRVNAMTGLGVKPTYSYFRVYKKGDVLLRHTDRPSCEVSLTLNLGQGAGPSWPIWTAKDNQTRSLVLDPGDALLYKGLEVAHWREQFEGERLAQVFLHYVDERGPHSEWAYDKRGALRTSPAAHHMVTRLATVGAK